MLAKDNLTKIHDWLYEIPKEFRKDMRVPARVYASEEMLDKIFEDKSLEQLVNVATLPGILKHAIVMPDAHEGYGFPIGGVAAFDTKEGIISPGGIGYDINCGVRLLRSELTREDIEPYLEQISSSISRGVPSGVGRGGRLVLSDADLNKVLKGGIPRMLEMGYGEKEDLEHIESGGVLSAADPSFVSDHAKKRGKDQLGTLGAGNHFAEIDVVENIFDDKKAESLNLSKDQVVVLIHTGSRGFGHQIATDYIRIMVKALPKYKIILPDRELACAPFKSQEGQNYFSAMAAGANFAWSNRQLITCEVRREWEYILGKKGGKLDLVYDVSHNMAKIEDHEIDGEKRTVVMHRKGATRAFPDQPVLIPGSMGTSSYVLVGQENAMKESFGSSCHGAGRAMSRTEARKTIQGKELKEELKDRGIIINAGSMSGLAEEAPQAYKDVDEVVDVVDMAGIAKKVARLRPLAVIKG